MPIEIPFYQRVSLSQMGNPISGSHVIRKDVVFQVGLDLRDLCIRIGLSFWILHAGMHRVSRDA
jgi:exosome complex RNA-binding protein Rrp42 (RNase PH superfamily)